jgi:hypothetical protein
MAQTQRGTQGSLPGHSRNLGAKVAVRGQGSIRPARIAYLVS